MQLAKLMSHMSLHSSLLAGPALRGLVKAVTCFSCAIAQMAMALLELQHHTDIRVHVPLSTDDQRNAQRVMVEDYLTCLLKQKQKLSSIPHTITLFPRTFSHFPPPLQLFVPALFPHMP